MSESSPHFFTDDVGEIPGVEVNDEMGAVSINPGTHPESIRQVLQEGLADADETDTDGMVE